MAGKTQSLSFRIDVSFVRKLDDGAELRGINRSDYLRVIVTDALQRDRDDREPLQALAEQVDDLGQKLTHKIAIATAALLTDLNKDPGQGVRLTREDIEAFVQKKLYS